MLDAEYVLPLRWHDDSGLDDLTAHLEQLAGWLDVTVVDGSPDALFRRHAEAWAGLVRHLAPAPWPGRNGKVRGVMTGVRAARHPAVVIGDDDVRWERAALERGLALLRGADLVVPQNVFSHWPWHARWDTGRQLLNRALGGDYPGTFVLRRDVLAAAGYDGDVLFENLELMRTVTARGGVVLRAPDLLVSRRPPTVRHFWGQRVRQAYDDFAQPARLVAEAALLPLLAAFRRRGELAVALAASAVVLAEAGRRRHGGRPAFPATAAWWAPVWLLERAVCVWLAIGLRLVGGVRYGDGRIRRAASTPGGRGLRPAPSWKGEGR